MHTPPPPPPTEGAGDPYAARKRGNDDRIRYISQQHCRPEMNSEHVPMYVQANYTLPRFLLKLTPSMTQFQIRNGS